MRVRALLLLLACGLPFASAAARTTAPMVYARAGFALDGVTPSGATHDEAASLYFNDLATEGWDPYDATKMPPLTYPAAQLAPMGPGPDGQPRRLAQRSLPFSLTVPVKTVFAFMASEPGTYTISVASFNGVPAGWRFTLSDEMMGIETALQPGASYTFTSEVTAYTERFILTVTPGVVTGTGAEPADAAYSLAPLAPNPAMVGAHTTLRVREAQAVRAEVYDALGRRMAVVFDGPIGAGTSQPLAVEATALPAGAYILRVMGTGFAATRTFHVAR